MRLRSTIIALILGLLLGLIPIQGQIPGNKLFAYSQGDIWTWFVNASSASEATDWNYNGGPILAPNERYVAYLSIATEAVEEIRASSYYPFAGDAPTNIWIMDTATQLAERIASQTNYPIQRGMPAWSPDGSEIAWIEVFLNESYRTRLVAYKLSTRETRVIADNINLGFQDGGLNIPTVQWGAHGISRFLFTFVESGEGHFILEVYNSASGVLSQFILATINTMSDQSGSLPSDYVWVQHEGRAMIAVLTNNGAWYLLDPVNGNHYGLSQAPSLVPLNGVDASLTPIWQSNREIRWSARRTNGGIEISYGAYGVSQGTPALSPDGLGVAWNNSGEIHYQAITNGDSRVIFGQQESFTAVQPASVVWTAMHWVTNVTAGNPIPTPVVSNPPTGNNACQLPSRLSMGSFVSLNPGVANNVRTEARLSAPISAQFPPGGFAQVTDGPVCVDGYRWWFVSNEVLAGWTAEGNNTDYWLVPLIQSPFLNNCPLAPRLRTGNTAIVLGTTPNALRNGPDANGTTVTGQIPVGASLRILGDSICGTDGRRWYPVNYNGQLAWTAEGEASSYWLEPR